MNAVHPALNTPPNVQRPCSPTSTQPCLFGAPQVDGEWRLASDWPSELDEAGNEVNVLTVD